MQGKSRGLSRLACLLTLRTSFQDVRWMPPLDAPTQLATARAAAAE